MIERILRRLCACAVSVALFATTAAAQDGGTAVFARPKYVPENASTNFEASLRCMDELLSRTQYTRGVPIYARTWDEGGTPIGAQTRDMIIAALARMTEKSRFFSIGVEPSPEMLASLPSTSLVVGGSVTAFERDVTGKNSGAGITLGPIGLGFQNVKSGSVMSISLYLQDGKGVVLPSTMQSLSMVLTSRSRSGDVSGDVKIGGGFFQMGFARTDGPLSAVRALIDLGLIQAVGAYAQVPYQRCLTLSQTDPRAIADARKAFDRMKPAQQIALIASALAQRGIYRGPATQVLTPDLREAIAAYQAQSKLSTLGLPTFEVYYSLYGASYGAPTPAPIPVIAGTPDSNPLGIRVAPFGPYFKAKGDDTFVIGKNYRASFAVTVARTGNVACFYIDAEKHATRIFPNPQRRFATLQPGDTLQLPGANDVFVIASEVEDAIETVTCAASTQPVERFLPAALQVDFAPGAPPLPVQDVESLVRALRQTGAPDLSINTLRFLTKCVNPETQGYLPSCS